MSLKDDFKEFFPEFTTLVVDAWWPRIEASWPCLYGASYVKGNCSATAILWLCGHLLATFSDPKYSGAGSFKDLSSASVGSVSTSFGARSGGLSANQAFFGSTPYGQMFLKMIQPCIGAMPA